MWMRSWIVRLCCSVILGYGAIAASPAPATELATPTQSGASESPSIGIQSINPDLDSDTPAAIAGDDVALEQVTSVSQLTDVKPTDWAFQALQSLVERYGCIVGYPDRTYRGNRALTRYEFAAGLNACLDKIQELIAAATADFVKKEDLEVVKRLQEEFAAELVSLRGRVETLEIRTATLETQQFSTTTKLTGNVIFSVADIVGADGGDTNQTVFQSRANLNFNTSFKGYDLFFVSLYAGNVPLFPLGGFRLPSTTTGGLPVNSAEGALGVAFGGNTNNQLQLLGTGYVFPLSSTVQAFVVGANTALFALIPTVNPLLDDRGSGTGAISLFGQRNAIYALGAAGAGAGMNWHLGNQVIVSGAYIADGFGANRPEAGSGFFNGGYTALGQITWNPSAQLTLAATYSNTYFTPGRFGFNYNGLPLMGTAVANTLAGQTRLAPGAFFNPSAVITNSYGVQAAYKVSPAMVISGWFGATYARLIGDGEGTILNYALTVAFPDLGKRGNLLGFVIGAEPYLTQFEDGNPQSFKNDIPFHLEGFYRYQINDRLSLTPGVIVLTAPNQDASNGVDAIANLRMTFTF